MWRSCPSPCEQSRRCDQPGACVGPTGFVPRFERTHPTDRPRSFIDRFAPGLRQLLAYRREWLRADLVAGVSVAAVAVPTAIAYAQLIGFEPVVGLYAAILPLVAYALFGTSRQLIVNPDAATCAVFAATVLPLAGSDPSTLTSLSVALSVLTGLVCIAAGLLRLRLPAPLLAQPPPVRDSTGGALRHLFCPVGEVVRLSRR